MEKPRACWPVARICVGIRVVSEVFESIDVLTLRRQEGFTAGAAFERNHRAVAEDAPPFGVVENRYAELCAVDIRQKQRAEITSRNPQQIGRQRLHQAAHVQL